MKANQATSAKIAEQKREEIPTRKACEIYSLNTVRQAATVEPRANEQPTCYPEPVNKEKEVRALVESLDHLTEAQRQSLAERVVALILEHESLAKQGALAHKKLRDYRPREGIVEYLTSQDGAGPWLEAGLLTRPFLFKHAPKAYRALRNYEARGLRLPANVLLPSRSEIVDREVEKIGEEDRRKFVRMNSAALRRSKQ